MWNVEFSDRLIVPANMEHGVREANSVLLFIFTMCIALPPWGLIGGLLEDL